MTTTTTTPETPARDRCRGCGTTIDHPDPEAMLCLDCAIDALRTDDVLKMRDDYLDDRDLEYKRALQAELSRLYDARATQRKAQWHGKGRNRKS